MIPEQRYHEDVAIGMELPRLTRGPFTIRDLVKFAAATDDYSEIHFDESVVRARGLPAPVVHGPLKSALLAQMLTGWIGPAGALKRLACQYRQMDVAGETLTCCGKVTGKTVRDGESIVECEVWTENGRGEVTTRGTALVSLPTRASTPAGGSRKEVGVAPEESQTSLITEQMRKDLKLGELGGRFTYEVDRKWIRQFAAAFEDPNPLWRDEEYARTEGRFGGVIAPPTFFAALDPVETKELVLDGWVESIPYKNTGGGNAFNEVEYFLPIRAGDTISVEVTYTDIFERDGRSGRLLFRIRENVLTNQRGERVGRARNGHVRSYDLSSKRED